ncbi:MAG: 1-deoxy-D-xylulose-5-phosphate synthase [Candidatus Omnitrophica bacterium]|nr:1-deoxy-D-xylulose-5-phosphate synthase [Candidatus Omnitrophota bacterium]
MILEKIDSPKDLKKLSIEELKVLCQEIRELIVKVVSKTGGHLASSLGAVEVCTALHYCLDTPRDSLIFDVGHQSYAHKILTGRRDKFSTLRQYKGISGFPNCNESEFDVYISGHASTAISWAQGIAEAKKIKKNNSKTIALVGDGSLTGGMCFEALNSCGHSQTDMLIIVNHNEMSISPSVGALSNYLTKIISAPIYNRLKTELENFLEHFSIAKMLVQRARKFEETIKGLIVPGIFFEELGFRYFGPIDGHSLDALVSTIKNVVSLEGPKVLHILSRKGKGYSYSEKNPEDYHGISLFDVDTGESLNKSEESYSEVFAKKLTSLAKTDKKIVAITAAMPKGTGLCIFQKKYPKRFFDVGIAEAHAVGFASGLAKEGLKPVVAIYSTFLQRSFDQIIHDVALQNLGVVFVLDRAGIVGEDGPTHHGVFDVGYLRLIPNMVCMAPKDKEEFEDMLEFALGLNAPVSIRFPRGSAYSLAMRSPMQLAKSETIKQGKEVCLLALGSMVKVAVECSKFLNEQGINAGVVNARFIKPLDKEMLESLVSDYNLVVTIEESSRNCGFASAVMEFYEQASLLDKVNLVSQALPDNFIPAGSREVLLDIYKLDARSLADKVIKHLSASLVD